MLAGCAARPELVWEHQDGIHRPELFNAENYSCLRDGMMAGGSIYTPPSGPYDYGSSVRMMNASLYHACMQAKGYRLVEDRRRPYVDRLTARAMRQYNPADYLISEQRFAELVATQLTNERMARIVIGDTAAFDEAVAVVVKKYRVGSQREKTDP